MAAAATAADEAVAVVECPADETFACAALDQRMEIENGLILLFRDLHEEYDPTFVRNCLRQAAFPAHVQPQDRLPDSALPPPINKQADAWKQLCLDIREARLEAMTAEQQERERTRLAEVNSLAERTLAAFDLAMNRISSALFTVRPLYEAWLKSCGSGMGQARQLHGMGLLSVEDWLVLANVAPGAVEHDEAVRRSVEAAKALQGPVWQRVVSRLVKSGGKLTLETVGAGLEEATMRVTGRTVGTGGDASKECVFDIGAAARLVPRSADWACGKVIGTVLSEGSSPATGLAMSQSGERLITTDGCGRIEWRKLRPTASAGDAAGWQTVASLKGHDQHTQGVCISPDDGLVATSCNGGAVRLWTAEGEAVCTLRESPPGRSWVRSVVFSADGGRVLAACYHENGLLVFDVASQTLESTVHAGRQLWAVDASRDGKWVVAGGVGGFVQLWDAASLKQGAPLMGSGSSNNLCVRFSPDASQIAVISEDNHLRVWNMTDTSRPALVVANAHAKQSCHVCWTADGKQLITTGGDGTVKVWDAATGGLPLQTLTGHQGQVSAVGVPASGDVIVSSGYGDSIIRVWTCKPIADAEDGAAADVAAASASSA